MRTKLLCLKDLDLLNLYTGLGVLSSTRGYLLARGELGCGVRGSRLAVVLKF